MLSVPYRLVEHHHRQYGLRPNLLYMNPWHYRKLLECLPEMRSQEEVSKFLMMQIVINPDALHSCVARLPSNVAVNLTRERDRIL